MDTEERLKEWARKMGYIGVISKSLQIMCNPATSHIWEQVMETVKPKAEVEIIRNSVLIDRIKNPSKLRDFQFPIRELEMWKKKKKLEEEIKNINERINDTNTKICHLSKQNKAKYLMIENLNKRIKENNEKTFLFDSKSAALAEDILQAEEKVVYCKNVTPTETTQNKSEVLDTLNKCAEKVAKLVSNQSCESDLIASESFTLLDTTFDRSEFTRYALAKEIYCFEDEQLLGDVGNMLRSNNNYLLWTVLMESIAKLNSELNKCINEPNLIEYSNYGESSGISVLLGKHVENELRALIHEQNIPKLQQELQDLRSSVFQTLKKINVERDVVEAYKNTISLQQKEAGLKAVRECMKIQVEAYTSLTKYDAKLLLTQKKSLDIQQQLVDKIRDIDYKIKLFERIYLSLLESRENTFSLVRKLQVFCTDLQWAIPLTRNLNAKEIDVFRQFNLEYNRQTQINGTKVFMKNLLTDDLVGTEDLDPNSLYMMVALIDNPCSPSETILFNLIRKKIKLSVLKSLQCKPQALSYKQYDLDYLRKEESLHINDSVKNLNNLLTSSHANRIQAYMSKLKEAVKLWLEMPMSDFVSKDKLFNGNSCEYYQNLFNSYYDKLQ